MAAIFSEVTASLAARLDEFRRKMMINNAIPVIKGVEAAINC